MSVVMTVSCQLLRNSTWAVEKKEPLSLPLIARCFVRVSAPLERSDQTRLCITASPPQAQSLTLEIPLVRDRDRGFLFWFEVSLALLPGIPLRMTVHDPALAESSLDVVMELANGHVQLRNDGSREAVIGELEEIVADDAFWFDSLGYTFLQAPWLLQLGGCLVQQHDSGNAYQMVRYLPGPQMYEYRLHFVSATGTPQDYLCLHNDLEDIAWEHAVALERFALGFSADPGMKQG